MLQTLNERLNGGRRSEWAINQLSELRRGPGHVAVSTYSRDDISVHGFLNWGTTMMFDIIIVNLNTGSYLRMTP